MTELLEISTLGGLSIQRGGTPVEGLASRKAEALLVYLACTGQPQPREVLADLLWDDRPQERALSNLRVLLSSLRRELGPFVTITRQTVAFNPDSPHRLDVADLEAGLAAGDDPARQAQALALYRGDFLRGFHLRGSRGFEEWLVVERERLRLQALDGLQRLVAAYLDLGDYPAGIEQAERLLQLDPLEEEAHRQLMLLLTLNGQRNAALAQYESCRQILAEELGLEPTPETTALFERIRDGEIGAAPGPAPPASPPPVRVPAPSTPLVDREEELAQIIEHLSDPACRLLTLIGPGGIGKTRLAIQAALQMAEAETGDGERMFPHGVFFIPLAPLTSASLLVSTIADALDFSFYSGEDPGGQLLDYLRQKQLLLVLDNFDHLLAQPGVDLPAEILQQAPQVKILAVSRERLNLQGEWLLPLQGLSVPEPPPRPAPQEDAAWDGAETFSAVQLFLQRARAVSPDFSLQGEAKPCVARICRLVEGIPLAIELAAAWIRMLSCPEIARQIEHNLDFLTTSLRNVPERHRSLRAVFDYSWQLLPPEEQQALRKLAVFRSGFQAEAAQRVAGASLPLLTALADKSLVRADAGRYVRHLLLWQYAAEKLDEVPAEREQVQDLHCQYYAAFLGQREARLNGGQQVEALAEIGQEIENVRVAWSYAIERGKLAAIEQALESLFHFYDMRSWFQEGLEAFERAAARLAEEGGDEEAASRPEAEIVLARLQARQGWFAFQLGRQAEAEALLQDSLARLRRLDTAAARRALVFPLNYLGAVYRHLGQYEPAKQHLQESLALCRELDDRPGLSIAFNILGQVAYLQGDYAQARDFCQESLAVKRDTGDQWGMAFSLTTLGQVAYALAEYAEAKRLFQESLIIRREIADQRGIALGLNSLGDVALALHDYREAEALFQESQAIFNQIGNRWGVTFSAARLGDVARALGQHQAAGDHFSQALRLAMEIEAVPLALDALVGMAALRLEAGGLEPERVLAILTLVLNHPAGSRENQDRAAGLLAGLEPQLAVEAVAAAWAGAQALTLEMAVEEVLQREKGDYH